MTIRDGVGTGPYTEIKLRHFQDIAKMWCAVVWRIFQLDHVKRNDPAALYIDATSGPGLRDGQVSCCIHFLNTMRFWRLPYRAVLIEKDAAIHSELSDAVRAYRNVETVWGDYQVVLNDKHLFPSEQWQFGLLYVDPNGPTELHFDAIAQLCERMPRVDFLTYTSATALKRYWQRQIRLSSIVGAIPKERWFVRLPEGEPHWTFLLGTGEKSPIKELAKANLFGIDDPRLQEAWFKMEYTVEEQKKILQPDLFTEPMPNTCATQPTGRYGPLSSSVRVASVNDARRGP